MELLIKLDRTNKSAVQTRVARVMNTVLIHSFNAFQEVMLIQSDALTWVITMTYGGMLHIIITEMQHCGAPVALFEWKTDMPNIKELHDAETRGEKTMKEMRKQIERHWGPRVVETFHQMWEQVKR
jgi:hypothetical protein